MTPEHLCTKQLCNNNTNTKFNVRNKTMQDFERSLTTHQLASKSSYYMAGTDSFVLWVQQPWFKSDWQFVVNQLPTRVNLSTCIIQKALQNDNNSNNTLETVYCDSCLQISHMNSPTYRPAYQMSVWNLTLCTALDSITLQELFTAYFRRWIHDIINRPASLYTSNTEGITSTQVTVGARIFAVETYLTITHT